MLLRLKLVNNDYQQNSRVLYTFVSSKSPSELLEMSPPNFTFLTSLRHFQDMYSRCP